MMIAPAAAGSSGDPTCGAGNGGTILVESKASGQVVSQMLPCARWTLLGQAASPRGYRYLDPGLADGPCRRVRLVHGALVMTCGGHGANPFGYDLHPGQDEAPVTVLVELGADRYCARFGGLVTKDGSDGLTFTARRPSTTTACE